MDSKNTPLEIIRDLLEFLNYDIQNIDDLYNITKCPNDRTKLFNIIYLLMILLLYIN